jgi:pyruvate carboxylase subunit B
VKYLVRIGGEDIEVVIERTAAGLSVTSGGQTRLADLVHVGPSPVYSLLLGDRSYEFSANSRNGLREIVLHGETYAAKVLDEHALLIAAASLGGQETDADETVAAPMPGIVVGVSVAAGDRVEAGHGVVRLEAMKMENELRCERGGVVKEVRVKVGQGVAQGEPLVVIGQPAGDTEGAR